MGRAGLWRGPKLRNCALARQLSLITRSTPPRISVSNCAQRRLPARALTTNLKRPVFFSVLRSSTPPPARPPSHQYLKSVHAKNAKAREEIKDAQPTNNSDRVSSNVDPAGDRLDQ